MTSHCLQRGSSTRWRVNCLRAKRHSLSRSEEAFEICNRLEQDAVLLRYLVGRSYENAARSIGYIGFRACGDEPHDLLMKKLPVTGMMSKSPRSAQPVPDKCVWLKPIIEESA